MKKESENTISPEARELVKMINEFANEIIFHYYEYLSVSMRMRLADIIINSQKMLDDDLTPTRRLFLV